MLLSISNKIGTGYCIGHILALWDVVAVELARKVTLTEVVS